MAERLWVEDDGPDRAFVNLGDDLVATVTRAEGWQRPSLWRLDVNVALAASTREEAVKEGLAILATGLCAEAAL
jgi:hypothetical protein